MIASLEISPVLAVQATVLDGFGYMMMTLIRGSAGAVCIPYLIVELVGAHQVGINIKSHEKTKVG